MRVVLSLFLLLSVLSIFTTNGCDNIDFPAEEEIIMAEHVNPISSNMTEGYKTATFALG
ncbi:MAG: hypothetical protein JSU79_10210 [Dehalococcoidales bacterium]|nr:MAG: hypothetical protein JSU79_10210 [Dehalococcoidales bacterium]